MNTATLNQSITEISQILDTVLHKNCTDDRTMEMLSGAIGKFWDLTAEMIKAGIVDSSEYVKLEKKVSAFVRAFGSKGVYCWRFHQCRVLEASKSR